MKFVYTKRYGLGWSTAMPTAALAQLVATHAEVIAAVEARERELADADFSVRYHAAILTPEHAAMVALRAQIMARFPDLGPGVCESLELSCHNLSVSAWDGPVHITAYDGREHWEPYVLPSGVLLWPPAP